MRTTITLDDDVAKKLKEKIKSSHLSAKKLYNELLRAALTEKGNLSLKKAPYKLITFEGKTGLSPGLTWELSTAQMLDKLDEEKLKEHP